MRVHGYTLRNRRGVGSIIGGAFFLLIMLVGYMVYSFSIQAINNQQQVLSDMRAYDIERSREAFKSDSEPIWSAGYLIVSIQNIGPKPAKIISIGYGMERACNGTIRSRKLQFGMKKKRLGDAFNPPVIIKSGSYKTFNASIPGVLERQQTGPINFSF